MKVVFLLFCLLLLVFCYRPLRIERVSIPFQEAWEVPQAACPWIDQRFSYLAEGTQAYVFLGQDQKTVLKLFKKEERHMLDACRLGLDIADLTRVLYIHLNPKPGLPKFTVRDRWGIPYSIDPAKIRFIVQQRATPLFHKLRSTPFEERAQLLASFDALLCKLRERGIANLDNSLGRNFGFIDGEAVVIDFGKCIVDPGQVDEREAHLRRRLNQWLLKNPFKAERPLFCKRGSVLE